MEIYDWICLEEVLGNAHYQFKAIFNARGIIFFPMSRQHRQTKAEGISYDDGPSGNAVAAVISLGQVDIRNDPRFAAETVRRILEDILQDGRLEPLRGFTVTYQGKVIKQGTAGKRARQTTTVKSDREGGLLGSLLSRP
jgi:hypothetical protein